MRANATGLDGAPSWRETPGGPVHPRFQNYTPWGRRAILPRSRRSETMKIRRVTTGHDARGKAVFVSDTQVEGDSFAQMPGAAFHRLWGADQVPKFPDSGSPPPYSDYFPPRGGFRFMTFTVAPGGQARLTPEERRALYEVFRSRLPGLAEHMERNSPGMHTTDTIDFEYIVSG